MGAYHVHQDIGDRLESKVVSPKSYREAVVEPPRMALVPSKPAPLSPVSGKAVVSDKDDLYGAYDFLFRRPNPPVVESFGKLKNSYTCAVNGDIDLFLLGDEENPLPLCDIIAIRAQYAPALLLDLKGNPAVHLVKFGEVEELG
jgi:hypothetical protein